MPSSMSQPALQTADLNPILGADQTLVPISTGVSKIDTFLRGGLPTGGLTEVYGVPGSGKTTFVLTLAATIAQSGHRAILLDCDGDVIPARLAQLLAVRGAHPSALQRIVVARVTSWEALTAGAAHLLPDEVRRLGNVRLIAVDSMAFLFRTALGSALQKRLETFAMRMQALASDNRLCVLFVNHGRVTTAGGPIIPAMGEAWQHICSTRLWMGSDMRGRPGIIEVQKSLVAPMGRAKFDIGEAGVIDAEDGEV